jgi:hypothetical protein
VLALNDDAGHWRVSGGCLTLRRAATEGSVGA